MADKDDDRDDRDSDAPEPKKETEKKSTKSAKSSKEPASEMETLIAEIRAIRKQIEDARAQQYPHLWLLFPIAALLAIQTIFVAMKL